MIRTIFFDAAGTLIEPAEPVAAVYVRHFAAAGWEVSEAAVKGAFRTVFATLPPPAYAAAADGDSAERAWWRSVVEETARASGIEATGGEFDACFANLFAHYASGEAWTVFPEVREVLARLREEGCRLAVVSNFDRRLHGILADFGLDREFEVVVTSADAGARKPDAAIFRHALAAMVARPSDTVHIGDHGLADGEGAAAVGIEAFVLDRPRTTLIDALGWLRLKN
ncbi:HAD-IIIA family hydrolase [Luteolibacter sp. LG18]|uniref:HAD-IIIA family hydrolase n=1 Tax=Luteolibacter sp. LG18 TaxID=2819286 RepID=UPI002B2BF427|nr:hypothetical protein llg_22760 [Luteolibacter sp. LG18]